MIYHAWRKRLCWMKACFAFAGNSEKKWAFFSTNPLSTPGERKRKGFAPKTELCLRLNTSIRASILWPLRSAHVRLRWSFHGIRGSMLMGVCAHIPCAEVSLWVSPMERGLMFVRTWGRGIKDPRRQRTPVLLPFCKRGRETSTVSHATRAKRAVRMILPLYWRFIGPCVRVCFNGQKQITMNKGDKVRSTIELIPMIFHPRAMGLINWFLSVIMVC